MAFDGLVVRALAQELNQKLSGARLDKIYQPERDTLVLQLLRHGGEKNRVKGHWSPPSQAKTVH